MGQVGSLGRLSKKGQVAPVGMPGPTVAAPQRMPERAAPVIGKKYPTYFYTTVISSFPAACMMVFTVVPFFLACVSLFSSDVMDFDTLIESFTISDHSTVRKRDVTEAATSDWHRILEAYSYQLETGLLEPTEDTSEPRRQSLPWKRIDLQFKIKVTDEDRVTECATSDEKAASFRSEFNLLTREDYLRFAKQVEQRIRILPLFQSTCFKSDRKNGQIRNSEPSCTPFTSYTQYFFPGDIRADYYHPNPNSYRLFWNFEYSVLQQGPGNTRFDTDIYQNDTEDVLRLFKQNPSWNWFTDASNDGTSLLLRTQIVIGRPFVVDNKVITDEHEAEAHLNRFYSFLTSYLDAVVEVTEGGDPHYTEDDLLKLWVTSVPKNLEVTYGGDGILESKLRDAMDRDFWYVFISVIIVLVAAWFYTHSFFIATMSIFQLTLTYFTGTFVHFHSRDERLSLLTLLSFYVLMSVSLNGVVVFFNTFRQSAFMETNGRKNTLNVPQRLAYCFRKAGAGVTISHMTAGVAFAMNAISPVPAIRDNGIFMLWLMGINIYMFLTFFPCVLILHHYHVSRRRRNAQRRKEILLRRKHLYHPPILRQTLRTLDAVSKKGNGMPTVFTAIEEPAVPPPQQETDADKMRVTQGDANGRFGFAKLAAKLRQRKPKTTEELVAEQEAAFDQFTGAMTRPQRCRRKQPYSSIIQLPVQYTSLTAVSKSLTAPARADTFEGEVDMQKYRDTFRQHWDEEVKGMHVSTYLGEDVFVDPSSQRKLDGVKKLPMMAQVIAESGTELRHVTSGVDWDVPPPGPEGNPEEPADLAPAPIPAPAPAPGPDPAAAPVGAATADLEFREVPLGNAPEVMDRQMNKSTIGKWCDNMANCCTLFSDWWTRRGQVKRRFGRFGKRVGETREEKDRRIMGKREKREGYTALERLFYNVYTPFLGVAYPFILAAYTLKLLLFIILVLSHLDTTSEVPRLLDYQSTYEKYRDVKSRFPISGNCDYCGPYHRPYTDFPPPFGRGEPYGTTNDGDRQAYERCGSMMFSTEDSCGVCGGDDDCVDCMGQRSYCNKLSDVDSCQNNAVCSWVLDSYCIDQIRTCPTGSGQYMAGWVFDDCGTCYLPGYEGQDVMVSVSGAGCEGTHVPFPNRCKDPNAICLTQPKTGDCNPCFLNSPTADPHEKDMYPAPTGVKGTPGYLSNCNVLCNDTSCPPNRGRCDIITGECVCHSDFVNGFFAHTNGSEYSHAEGRSGDCGKCLDGFLPVDADDLLNWPTGTSLCSSECIEETTTVGNTSNTTDACKCKCNTDPSFTPTETVGKCMCQSCDRYDYLDADNFTVGYSVPRGDSPLWYDKIAGVGENCSVKQRSRCDKGELDDATGGCVCDPEFDDGYFCRYEVVCNKRGKRVDGACVCVGCWGGEFCEDSLCSNSGKCPELEGDTDPVQVTCQCGGAWQGIDCSECPVGCQTNSHCPLHWPHSLKGKDISEVPVRYWECGGTTGNQCFGNWEGATCDSCKFPATVPQALINNGDVMCDSKGDIIGCDGVPATDTHFKWVDNCGVCTNALDSIDSDGHFNNKCVLCPDGTVPNSCGSCLPSAESCKCDFPDAEDVVKPKMVEFVAGLKPTASVDIKSSTWDYNEDGTSTLMSESIPRSETFSFRDSQYKLREVCYLVYGENGELYVDRSYTPECVMHDWADFLYTHVIVTGLSGNPIEMRECGTSGCSYEAARAAPDEQVEPLTFPCTHKWIDWIAYQFTVKKSKADYIGFTGADPSRAQDVVNPLRVAWVKLRFRLPDFVQRGNRVKETYDLWQNFLNGIKQTELGRSGVLGDPFQWSEKWIEYFTEQQARSGTLYAIGLGGAAFAAIAVVFSCSLTLMLLASLSGMGIVIMTMSYMKLAGWELGPPEQVGLTFLVGIAAEYTVHIMEGYLEYIHATQSSLLARETTREAAVAGALQRTGVPVAFSCCTILVASCMILLCEILVYRRIAEIMIMVTLISSIHSLCIFPCLLLFAGPITVLRNWNIRLLWAITVGLCVCFTLSILYLLGTAKDPAGDDLF